MRIGMICGVLSLLLSNFCFLPAAMAQGELKTPDCVNPQEPMERVCCQSPMPQVCQPAGYKVPDDQDTSASSIPPLNEVAVLAPWGATIGMQLSDLDAKLKAYGLRRSNCQWRTHNSQDVSVTVSVSLLSEEGTQSQSCVKDLPIYTIGFQQNESREGVFSKLPSTAEVAAEWVKRFGEPVNGCRPPYHTPGGSQTLCVFRAVGADIKNLNLGYEYQDNRINRFAALSVSITGFNRKEAAESAMEENAGAASGDTRSAEAILESQMRIPMGRPLICQSIRNTMKYGNDYIIEGVTIVDKGQLLTDMPEACKN